MKRLCYFVNSDWYFDLHWTERAIAARDAGYEIHVISHFIGEEIIKNLKRLVLFVTMCLLLLSHLMCLFFLERSLTLGRLLKRLILTYCIVLRSNLA